MIATAGDSALADVRICLTPTRNESWIIEKFVDAANLWADHIIVADQLSTDATPQLAQRHPKVKVVVNDSPVFDEVHRQKLLLSHARVIPGRRVLFALDADEALSANSPESTDWTRIAAAPPGTIIRLRWVNILPGFQTAWIPREYRAFGLIDDGSDHSGQTIHNPRLPWKNDAPTLDLEEIVVLHFQYVVWERMRSKQRWYQTWEFIEHRKSGPLDIFRQYNHMNGGWESAEIEPIRSEWIHGFAAADIDFSQLRCEPLTWWDKEVLNLLLKHGPQRFRRLAIWDVDWNRIAEAAKIENPTLGDPRSALLKLVHRMLAISQNRRSLFAVRAFERLLRGAGW